MSMEDIKNDSFSEEEKKEWIEMLEEERLKREMYKKFPEKIPDKEKLVEGILGDEYKINQKPDEDRIKWMKSKLGKDYKEEYNELF